MEATLMLSLVIIAASGLIGFALAKREANRLTEKGRRIERGQCAQCGYDLRASGETCPECGNERYRISPYREREV